MISAETMVFDEVASLNFALRKTVMPREIVQGFRGTTKTVLKLQSMSRGWDLAVIV